jgi:dihydroflavonol-4-reductase
MNTIGIIGGLDFLGCDITIKFLSENFRVKVLVLPSPKNRSCLIQTGLVAGENLLIHHFGLENHDQLVRFLIDCDFLVHCGSPYEIPLKAGDEPVYVPVITGTGNLLRAMKKVSAIKKVFFLTSIGPANYSKPNSNKNNLRLTNAPKIGNSKVISEALLHSKRITDNLLEVFNSTSIELIVVSPVILRNNLLMNTVNATLHGIRFLLRNQINHDLVFQKLISRIMVETMINVNDLPDKIFDSFQASEERHADLGLAKY